MGAARQLVCEEFAVGMIPSPVSRPCTLMVPTQETRSYRARACVSRRHCESSRGKERDASLAKGGPRDLLARGSPLSRGLATACCCNSCPETIDERDHAIPIISPPAASREMPHRVAHDQPVSHLQIYFLSLLRAFLCESSPHERQKTARGRARIVCRRWRDGLGDARRG